MRDCNDSFLQSQMPGHYPLRLSSFFSEVSKYSMEDDVLISAIKYYI